MARRSQLWFLGLPIQLKSFSAKQEDVAVRFTAVRNVFILDRQRKSFVMDESRKEFVLDKNRRDL